MLPSLYATELMILAIIALVVAVFWLITRRR